MKTVSNGSVINGGNLAILSLDHSLSLSKPGHRLPEAEKKNPSAFGRRESYV